MKAYVVFLVLFVAGCGGGSLGPVTSSAGSGPAPAAGGPLANSGGAGGEMPRQADAFADAAGLNVHLGYYGTLYADNAPLIRALLIALGVRHVRDGIFLGQTAICQEDQQLGAAGIHFDFVTATTLQPSDLAAWEACAGTATEAIEGPNEYDIGHPPSDPNWITTLIAYQTRLDSGVKSISSLTVIAPALTSESAYVAVGSLANAADVGNVHDYFAGRNPGTAGWGGTDALGAYGTLAYDLALAAIDVPKPAIATETGYSDGGDQYPVPAATKMRYTLRTLLEAWNAGVPRTYLYELIDEGVAPFSHYGLADAQGNPKPAYVALKGLLAHLADPGPAFAPTPLNYTLAAPASVHHALFQKRSGAWSLAVWIESPEWDPVANAALPLVPQNVTLAFAGAPRSLQTTTFSDSGTTSTSAVSLSSNGSLVLQATGGVTILDITP